MKIECYRGYRFLVERTALGIPREVVDVEGIPGLGDALSEVVERFIAKAREDRFRSATVDRAGAYSPDSNRAADDIAIEICDLVREVIDEGYPNVPLRELAYKLRVASEGPLYGEGATKENARKVLVAAIRLFAVTAVGLALVVSSTALGARVIPYPASIAPKPLPVYAPKPVPTPRPAKGDR